MIEISALGKERYEQFCELNPEFADLIDAIQIAEDSRFQLAENGVVIADAQVTQKSVETWGENCWLQFGNYGFRDQSSLKTLFTQLAQTEAERGVTHFYVEVPAADEPSLKSWFELGFGLQHVSGIHRRRMASPQQLHSTRELREGDLKSVAELERELTLHQMQSPVFSRVEPQSVDEIMSEWRQELDNDEFVTRIVEVDHRVAGFAYGCSTEKSGLHSGLLRPPNSATLAFCTVLPEFRRRGIAAALTASVLRELRERGFNHVVTDWRATNQLSSNTWPRLGFDPTIYRLHRAI